jgi:GPH family glycoside/pentoside/hexuronide:cation symporter
MATTATAQMGKQQKYLHWYNKIGYGSGDLAANCVYGLLTSFVMIYLTDSVGLSAGIVGTLIMASKFFDGFTDIIFGNLLDRTHTKMGKARPWMLWSQLGNSLFLILCFAIPTGWGKTAQYIYFFICYTLLNAVFYTANNIAYAALTSLITKNTNERVQIGSIRFMFSLGANLTIAYITQQLVVNFGGGTQGWRTVAIIYAIVALIVNTISVFSVRELPQESNAEVVNKEGKKEGEVSIFKALKILFSNKYFLLLLLIYIAVYLQTGFQGIGVYFMRDILGDPNLYGTFSVATLLPMIVGLVFTPMLVAKFKGMYKVNMMGYTFAVICRIIFVIAGLTLNVPVMLISAFFAGLGTAPLTGDLNALISSTTDYAYRKTGVHVEGAMFSASSVGIKVGGGIGTALSGWILEASGYIGTATSQPASYYAALKGMYLWFPLIVCIIMTCLLSQMTVEKANAKWEAEHPGMLHE